MLAGLRLGVLALAMGLSASPASADELTVVELFQSQGCSSCPPANDNIMQLTNRPDLLVLSFGVTYWDRLGWKDTFASHENTQRQYDYAKGLGRRNVATPEVIINGRIDITGLSRSELDRSIASAKLASTPEIKLSSNAVSIAQGPASAQRTDVWLVRYDPRVVQVPIKAGENSGRTLPHRNVVRELVKLGEWSGKSASFNLPATTHQAYRTAILLQKPLGGPIIAAVKS